MKLKPCPFCSKVPKIRLWIAEDDTWYYGHYAVRDPCCPVMGCGQTELFFTRPGRGHNIGLWRSMCNRVVDQWNRRTQGGE